MAETVLDSSSQPAAIRPVPPRTIADAREPPSSPARRLSPAAGDITAGTRPRPPFDRIALLLQGGGALGAYQAGVYQSLAEADLHPDWVAGVSVGAINAALIAGNPPEARVETLRRFWQLLTSGSLWSRALFADHGRNQLWGDLAAQASEVTLANIATAFS